MCSNGSNPIIDFWFGKFTSYLKSFENYNLRAIIAIILILNKSFNGLYSVSGHVNSGDLYNNLLSDIIFKIITRGV